MPLAAPPLGGRTSRRVPSLPGAPPAGSSRMPGLAGPGSRLLAVLAAVALVGLLLVAPGPAVGVANAQGQTCQGQPATIVGTGGADRLQGTDGADVIVGLAGNDRIEAVGGNDVVCAGTGDDELRGGNGDDSLDGQAGSDRLGGDAGTDFCQNGENNAGCEDFVLAINHNGPTGFLVIGGLAGCPQCVSAAEPRYIVADPLGCFYDQNSIGVVSTQGDFAGTVNLQVLNLPQGVSNQTAASVNVPRGGVAITPFRLRAAANAAAGTATVTLRATSGPIVHTADLPISVVAQLPPCQ
jgi:RTX calcium-binding nonapeptide repeat (4 copies)